MRLRAWLVTVLLTLGYTHAYYNAWLRRRGELAALRALPLPRACELLLHPSETTVIESVGLAFSDTRHEVCRAHWARVNQSDFPNPVLVFSDWCVHTLIYPAVHTVDLLLRHHGLLLQVVLLGGLLSLVLGLAWIHANKRQQQQQHNKMIYYDTPDTYASQRYLLMP